MAIDALFDGGLRQAALPVLGFRLVVAANRAPYQRTFGPLGAVWSRPAGGLTAALDPLMQRAGGLWYALGQGSDQELMVPPEDPAYQVVVVGADAATYRGHYNGYANSGLWPLFHNFVERARFRRRDFQLYREANQLIADRIAAGAGPDDFIWVHDYQLLLVPGMLRERGLLQPLAHFLHIPWPPTSVLRLCPERRQLLQSLLACDWLGFQTEESMEAFASSARRELGARLLRGPGGVTIASAGRTTRLQALPISIDAAHVEHLARADDTTLRMERLRPRLGLEQGRQMLLGVDRLDYTKGIPARLDAFAWILEHRPDLRGRLVFVQVAAPTRTEIEDYRQLAEQVRSKVQDINSRFGEDGWQPILLIEHSLRLEILVALYRLADVAVVSSLYDGLNLVAKEYVAARVDGDGALCLSETAGAYNELRDAFPLSPLMPERMGEGILRALSASEAERRERMRRLQTAVHRNTIDTWLGGAIEGVKLSRPDRFSTPTAD